MLAGLNPNNDDDYLLQAVSTSCFIVNPVDELSIVDSKDLDARYLLEQDNVASKSTINRLSPYIARLVLLILSPSPFTIPIEQLTSI